MTSKAKRVLREAKASLSDKGDQVVHLKPAGVQSGVQLDIESKVMSMFGEQIRASVLETIESHELTGLHVSVRDQMAALDYTIRARVQTAVGRAIKEDYP